MKILLLSSAYNGLSQRIHVELSRLGHDITVELVLNDQLIIEAVELFQPDLILCPFLKHRVPETIWQQHVCIIIHPGIKGDRGASSLDWAIQNKESHWGVTALQAVADMDAGDIWAAATFPMRSGSKSSLYTLEVTEAAAEVALKAVDRFQQAGFVPEKLDYYQPDVLGQLRPTMKQNDREINWLTDSTEQILDKIWAADGSPGVVDSIFGEDYYLYGATREDKLTGDAGDIIATRCGAICRATHNGAIWLSHLKRKAANNLSTNLKLPAAQVLGDKLKDIPERPLSIYHSTANTFREIWYEEKHDVGYLHFDFHNGAMSTGQCQRLRNALNEIQKRPTKVLVLMGGRSAWSNGIHLNIIEAAHDPAEESWQNINAIDDLVLSLLTTTDKITFAAVHGNAGAGGVMLALACDKVCARSGIIFNPHYRSMGLYGSEYWTYTLPKRVGYEKAQEITQNCLPMGMQEAKKIGLVDFVISGMFAAFDLKVEIMAESIAQSNNYEALLQRKRTRREHDEFLKPLKYFRQEELRHMHDDFFKITSTYHSARKNFVYKVPISKMPVRSVVCRVA